MRQNISSGASWEAVVGYSRAVRVGNIIQVAGTTAVDDAGKPFAPGDPYAQTVRILDLIETALKQAGGGMEDVVRTRIFVTDISHWEEIGRAHGERFAAIRPAATMVQVAALIDPALMVEIEAEAILE
ncbi:MAG TPA: RidA family protein [Chloroflexota bacterium]|nr:RidA family protein [Chloroflexota bacterium]